MDKILTAAQYDRFRWSTCNDLTVISLLRRLQSGFIRSCCFLCMWDSRGTAEHHERADWDKREAFISGESNGRREPLVNPFDVLLPLLLIKLGLMKNVVNAMDKCGPGFLHISAIEQAFPQLIGVKLKEGIFPVLR